jgi:hypothetical protein
MTLFLDFFFYFGVLLAGLLVGAVVGALGGLGLGWLVVLTYEKRGPCDPGDHPMYFAFGLIIVGCGLGAIAGLSTGAVLCVRLARRKAERPFA